MTSRSRLFNVIWFEEDRGAFTLVDHYEQRVVLSESEVKSDGYDELVSEDDIASAVESRHYVISEDNLSRLFGIS